MRRNNRHRQVNTDAKNENSRYLQKIPERKPPTKEQHLTRNQKNVHEKSGCAK
jgi:hypothetical protein